MYEESEYAQNVLTLYAQYTFHTLSLSPLSLSLSLCLCVCVRACPLRTLKLKLKLKLNPGTDPKTQKKI
jgi:hypothetical protein